MASKLTIPEDYIWMSYRYCIGRHTIASHCHATQIAQDAYGKLSKERSQFNSEDINREIYDGFFKQPKICSRITKCVLYINRRRD
jgi:hypothetical protein